MSVVRTINGHGFMAGLSQPVRGELAVLSTRREFGAGAVIFREGAVCDELFLIDSGLAAIEVFVPGRGLVRILTVGPGELLGWSALLGSGPMTATATALEATAAFAVSGTRLRALCEQNAAAGYQIMRQAALVLSQRLTATRLQILDLFAEPIPKSP